MDSASGLSSMTALSAGPCLSTSSIRAEYFSTSERAVNLLDFMPSCNSEIVISSSSNDFTAGGPTAGSGDEEAARAALSAGYTVTALPVMMLLRRNERRVEESSDELIIFRSPEPPILYFQARTI